MNSKFLLATATATVALLTAACGSSSSTAGSGSTSSTGTATSSVPTTAAATGSAPASGSAPSAGGDPGSVTVGSADFSESTILAYVYGDALAAKGVKVSY
jgi:osmoprotectant transport system substrate-binding protein